MQDKHLVNNLLEFMNYERVTPIRIVLWYGSRLPNSDIDLLIICDGNPTWKTMQLGKLDLICMSIEYAQGYCQVLDPIVLEPLFQGEILQGSVQIVDEMKLIARNAVLEGRATRYLLQKSFEQYENTNRFLLRFDQLKHQENLLWALINLSYSFAYLFLARQYALNEHKDIITIARLRREFQLFEQIWIYTRSAKKKPSELKKKDVVVYCDKWQDILLRDAPIFSL